MSILLGILTFVLILVSLFLVMVVLMQKSKDSGMGAALGGGAAEAAFGADTANVLTKATKYSAILFFVLALALYLGRIYERKHASAAAGNALPNDIVAPAIPPAAAPAAAAPTTGATGTTTPAVSVPLTTGPESPAPAVTTTPAPAAPVPEAPKKQ